MNTNNLAKLYDRLTPAERLPLIIAASRRGDEAERCHLAQSAPRTGLWISDHFALALALQEAATFHVVDLLNLAVKFWQGWGLWGWCQHPSRRRRPDEEARILGIVQLHAYLFTIHVEGWRRFCAEQKIEPEALLDFLPGYEMIERTREHVQGVASTHAEATIFLRLQGKETEVPPTEEDVLHSLRGLFKERAAWWDGSSA